MSEHFNELADQLEAISEQLADAAMTELTSSIRRGDQKRPASERTLTQARRAIEKAAHLLRNIDADTGAAPGSNSDQFD